MATPRILFFGYSEVGYECLSLLLERGDHVVALITHEDNPHEKIWFKTPALAAREMFQGTEIVFVSVSAALLEAARGEGFRTFDPAHDPLPEE